MKAIFKSQALQKKFENHGFVKIPLLSDEEVKILVDEYEKIAQEHEQIGIPYITTSHSNNAELIEHVDKILQKTIAPTIDKYMTEYKLLFGNYLIKMPLENSETDPHQDITFVDESQYSSVNIWVALQDVDEDNGCMYFLKGSHKLAHTIRPTHDYKWMYEYVKDEIRKGSEIFPAKAGDAFVFNHAVVHGSFANKSAQPRVAAVIAAYSSDAPLIHYYLPDISKNTLRLYSMDKEAFLHFKKGEPPAKGKFLQEVEHEFNQLSAKEYKRLVEKRSGFWSRVGL